MPFQEHTRIAIAIAIFCLGLTLIKYSRQLPSGYTVESSQSDRTDVFYRDFSDAEPWGRWSVGSSPVVIFKKSIPERVKVVFELKGFGPNINEPLSVAIGGIERTIIIPEEMQTFELTYDQVAAFNQKITFRVPKPISPAQLGTSADPRKLGIGLKSIRLEVM